MIQFDAPRRAHRSLGPLAPSCFRLEGPDALPDAEERFTREAATFGAITSNELTQRERAYWSLAGGAS
jgi:dimethylaniline monooxygenase (N-oxide forming)